MLIKNLTDDLLNHIWTIFVSNSIMNTLRCCCKRFKSVCDTYGYVRELELTYDTNYQQFIKLWSKNLNSVAILKIYYKFNPIIWIPTIWPWYIEFEMCDFNNLYINPPISPTEHLKIKMDKTQISLNIIKINWEKLPQLKTLDLQVSNIDISELHQCKFLTKLILWTDYKYNLPKNIEGMSSIKVIQTNLVPTIDYINKSKKKFNPFSYAINNTVDLEF